MGSKRLRNRPAEPALSPDVVREFLALRRPRPEAAAHRRGDRLFDLQSEPLAHDPASPTRQEPVQAIRYVAYDDVLCRLPGKNHARLERYSPLDEAWVWYGPHAATVRLLGKPITERDAAAMAERLFEERESSTFCEESMPEPVGVPASAIAPALPASTPDGVDAEDFRRFLAEQAEKRKARRGPGHVCALPGFDAETMECKACEEGA